MKTKMNKIEIKKLKINRFHSLDRLFKTGFMLSCIYTMKKCFCYKQCYWG